LNFLEKESCTETRTQSDLFFGENIYLPNRQSANVFLNALVVAGFNITFGVEFRKKNSYI
jgi:hypothetical protein